MRFYIVTALVTVLLLVVTISYKQELFYSNELPYDDEQTGLADQKIIHFSHVVAENTPKGLAATKFAQLVEEKSNGKIIVQIYPNSIMYHDGNEMDALRRGDVQMIAPTISKVTSYLPNWQVLDLPFLIETNTQLFSILHGELGEALLAELELINVKGMTFWTNGFKQMIAKDQALVDVDDFKQLTFRTMNSTILEKQFTLLGGKTVVTTFNDLYHELTTDDIAGQENTLSNVYSKGYYKFHPHITLSNHGILSYAIVMNQNFWDSLSAEEQAIISESLDEIRIWQHEQAVAINEQNLQALQQIDGVHIQMLSTEQRDSWKQQLEPIYDYYSSHINNNYLQQLRQELHYTK
ncbi:MAG: DctP family TRAP transporter solute-binding subunit [Solibacillus sp.]